MTAQTMKQATKAAPLFWHVDPVPETGDFAGTKAQINRNLTWDLEAYVEKQQTKKEAGR